MSEGGEARQGSTSHETQRAREAVEHALRAIDAGQYGEAWLALKHAMRSLEASDV